MDFIAQLKAFPQAAYNYLGKAKDATFELMDSILLTRNAYSFADLSLSPVFRRKWPSVYEALQDCRPQRQQLMELYIEQIPSTGRIILAGDHRAWPRPDAVTLQERTIEHHCVGGNGNLPITFGEGYSTIAWVPEAQGSWALPLRHERITSWESPIDKAVWQLKQVCKSLPVRPYTVWDCEYGCVPFILKTADIPADKLMRLRSNLCLWGTPPLYCGKGRPRVDGNKFKLNDPYTWTQATQISEQEDTQIGKIRLRLWQNLHFRGAPKQELSLLLVERLNSDGSKRVTKPLWLAWVGEVMPTLEEVWKIYLRRFGVDHWYRFAKQRLHWTLPKLSTPKQCERWSDLMPLITWELWLARDIVTDNPLPSPTRVRLAPRQKITTKLTPGRVAQSIGGVLALIGTPASPPKPRGKSSGWKQGNKRQSRIRYPIVKKGTHKRKFRASKSA